MTTDGNTPKTHALLQKHQDENARLLDAGCSFVDATAHAKRQALELIGLARSLELRLVEAREALQAIQIWADRGRVFHMEDEPNQAARQGFERIESSAREALKP